MLFDKLCRYIAYGWSSVETQQIPAILEVGRSTTCRPDYEVHARGIVPDVVFSIECRFIRTDLTSGTFRGCGPGVCPISQRETCPALLLSQLIGRPCAQAVGR